MGLGRIRSTKKLAEAEAKRFRRSFKKRGIKNRRVVVKPVGRVTLKKLTTAKGFKALKGKKRFGVFFFNKK